LGAGAGSAAGAGAGSAAASLGSSAVFEHAVSASPAAMAMNVAPKVDVRRSMELLLYSGGVT
jgi:hypothetical protein